MNDTEPRKKSKISAWIEKAIAFASYCWSGVWKETRDTRKVRVIKTLNLSVRSFMDRNLQNKSMSLTYSTVLAIVPAFALMLAIARGFGFQDLLQKELYAYFPAQRQATKLALSFVDSYLKEASQGVFVGVGIVFLLWTLISLLSNIEEAFNAIWDVKRDRSFYRKVTDYIAICLMVPVLMICSAGISIFMSTTIQDMFNLSFLTPVLDVVLEASPLVLCWLAFTLSFFLIPNTKVMFKYSAISGAICAVAFQILQLLFVNGQIYVSKYNAIYGSFSFLPLMLIWLQLSWLILLFGCVLTYSLQNVFAFNFLGDSEKMSYDYSKKVAVILMTAVVKRFEKEKTPLTRAQLSDYYDIPIRIVTNLCEKLYRAKLISYTILPNDRVGISPAVNVATLSAGELFRRLDNVGDSNFIPRFSIIYGNVLARISQWFDTTYKDLEPYLLKDIELPVDKDKEVMLDQSAITNPFDDDPEDVDTSSSDGE